MMQQFVAVLKTKAKLEKAEQDQEQSATFRRRARPPTTEECLDLSKPGVAFRRIFCVARVLDYLELSEVLPLRRLNDTFRDAIDGGYVTQPFKSFIHPAWPDPPLLRRLVDAKHDSSHFLRLLVLRHGFDVDTRVGHYSSLLGCACHSSNVAAARTLVKDLGASVECSLISATEPRGTSPSLLFSGMLFPLAFLVHRGTKEDFAMLNTLLDLGVRDVVSNDEPASALFYLLARQSPAATDLHFVRRLLAAADCPHDIATRVWIQHTRQFPMLGETPATLAARRCALALARLRENTRGNHDDDDLALRDSSLEILRLVVDAECNYYKKFPQPRFDPAAVLPAFHLNVSAVVIAAANQDIDALQILYRYGSVELEDDDDDNDNTATLPESPSDERVHCGRVNYFSFRERSHATRYGSDATSVFDGDFKSTVNIDPISATAARNIDECGDPSQPVTADVVAAVGFILRVSGDFISHPDPDDDERYRFIIHLAKAGHIKKVRRLLRKFCEIETRIDFGSESLNELIPIALDQAFDDDSTTLLRFLLLDDIWAFHTGGLFTDDDYIYSYCDNNEDLHDALWSWRASSLTTDDTNVEQFCNFIANDPSVGHRICRCRRCAECADDEAFIEDLMHESVTQWFSPEFYSLSAVDWRCRMFLQSMWKNERELEDKGLGVGALPRKSQFKEVRRMLNSVVPKQLSTPAPPVPRMLLTAQWEVGFFALK